MIRKIKDWWFRNWWLRKSRIVRNIKYWPMKKVREWVSKAIDYDAILVGSEIRMLKKDTRCLNNNHEWQDWSASLCGNIQQMDRMGDDKYSYRACRHCKIEMPKSRIYHETGVKEENAKDFMAKPYLKLNEKIYITKN